MIRNILFDFDGTLVDSAPGIVKTMEQTFLKMRVEVPSEAEMRSTIGLPLQKALQMLGQLSDEDAAKAAVIYRELMQASFAPPSAALKRRSECLPNPETQQGCPGTNYLFVCKDKSGSTYQVITYQKLPAYGGETEVTSIEKE